MEEDNKCEDNVVKSKRRNIFSTLWNSPNRNKYLLTLCFYFAFFVIGWILGQRGPSFLDLQLITNTNLEKASVFFTAGYLGYLLGALGGGILTDRINRMLLHFISILGTSIATGALPWCSNYFLMLAMFLVGTVFIGSIDAGVNASLVMLWGTGGKSAMQGLHFIYNFGGGVSPLVTEPFLSTRFEATQNSTFVVVTPGYTRTHNVTVISPNSDNKSMNQTGDATVNILSVYNHEESKQQNNEPETYVQYAFMLSAIMGLLSSIPFFFKYCQNRKNPENDTFTSQNYIDRNVGKFPLHILIPGLFGIAVFYFMHHGVLYMFKDYLFTFVVEQLQWSKADGTLLMTCFYVGSAVAKFLLIFLIYRSKPATLLLACCVLALIFSVGLVPCAVYGWRAGIWICVCACGCTTGSVFATGITWIHLDIVAVSGKVMAVILVSGSLAGIINPLLLGYLMTRLNKMVFLYMIIIQNSVCGFAFGFLWTYGRKVMKNFLQTQLSQGRVELVDKASELLKQTTDNIIITKER